MFDQGSLRKGHKSDQEKQRDFGEGHPRKKERIRDRDQKEVYAPEREGTWWLSESCQDDVRGQRLWRNQINAQSVITTWGLTGRQGWSPSLGAGFRQPSAKTAQGWLHWLARSVSSYGIPFCGPDAQQPTSVISPTWHTAYIPFGLLIPKRLIAPIKRQHRARLESWLPLSKKIGAGSSACLGAQTRTELVHPKGLLSEQSPNIVGDPSAATTEWSFFPC